VSPVVELLKAWRSWDRQCDRRRIDDDAKWRLPTVDATVAMENAVTRLVAVYGLDPALTRERLASSRRAAARLGMDRFLANRWAIAVAMGHT
jgi:hypothetical protein